MEAQEQTNGKFAVVFNTREEAELHIAALQTTAPATVEQHTGLVARIGHLVARLHHHGIPAADQPLAEPAAEVHIATLEPAAPAAVEGSAAPVVTRNGFLYPPVDTADVLAAEEGK